MGYKTEGEEELTIYRNGREVRIALDLSGVSVWTGIGRSSLPYRKTQDKSLSRLKTKAYQEKDTRQSLDSRQSGHKTKTQDKAWTQDKDTRQKLIKTQDKSFSRQKLIKTKWTQDKDSRQSLDSRQELKRQKKLEHPRIFWATGISHTHSCLLSYDACLHVIACACSFKREEQVYRACS